MKPLLLLLFAVAFGAEAALVPVRPSWRNSLEVAIELDQAKGIPHSVRIVPYDTDMHFDLARMIGKVSFEVLFGKLRADQVEQLNHAYRGSAEFDPEREYRLQDFLPLSMKSVLGNRYVDPVNSTNCWTTAYEFLRNGPTFGFFYVGPEKILPLLRSEAIGTVVQEPRFGDLLLITHQGKLHHAAIYVDGNLYFEKTGLSREMAFRIAYRADIEFAFTPRAYDYELRRIHGQLPHPKEAFGALEDGFVEELPLRTP